MRNKKKSLLVIFFLIYFNLVSSQQTDFSLNTLQKIENQIKEAIKTEYIFNHIYKSKYNTNFNACPSNDNIKYIKDLKFYYQETDFSLFGNKVFFIKVSSYIEDNDSQIKLPRTFINDLGLEKGLLISYSDECVNILSGDIYNSLFSHEFKLNSKDPKSFYTYLKIKLYVYGIKEFEYKKQDSQWMYFSGIETIFTKATKVYFKIKKDFPDIVVQLGSKISGKYKDSEKIIIN